MLQTKSHRHQKTLIFMCYRVNYQKKLLPPCYYPLGRSQICLFFPPLLIFDTLNMMSHSPHFYLTHQFNQTSFFVSYAGRPFMCASFDFSACHIQDICTDFPVSHLQTSFIAKIKIRRFSQCLND